MTDQAGECSGVRPYAPDPMTVLDVLLEGFDDAKHPRGWHGRWIGTSSGKVLRVFHGDTHVGDVKPGQERTQTMIGVGRVVGDAGRTISTKDIATVVDHAKGSPAPSPRTIRPGGSANELHGGIPRAPSARASSQRYIATFHHPVHGTVTSPVDASSPDEAWKKAKSSAMGTVQSVTPHTGIGWDAKTKRLEGHYQGVKLERGVAYQGKLATGEIFTGHWTGEVNGSNGAPIFKQIESGARRTFEGGSGFGRLADVASAAPAPADRHGGFKVGEKVSYRTPSIVNGRVEGYSHPQHGEVAGHQRNGYVRVREPKFGTTVDVHHSNLQREGGLGNPDDPANPRRQQARDAQLHAQTVRHLENLGQGRYLHVAGVANGGAFARRTAAGFEVYPAGEVKPEKVHKTPSAAAAHMIRIRKAGLRESAPEVLGALLEARS